MQIANVGRVARVVAALATAGLLSSGRAAEGWRQGRMVFHDSAAAQLVVFDVAAGTITPTGVAYAHPALSPDGKFLAAIDNHSRLHLVRLADGEDEIRAAERSSYSSPTFVTSETIAYFREDRRGVKLMLTSFGDPAERAWAGQYPEIYATPQIAFVPGAPANAPAFVLVAHERGQAGLWLLSSRAPKLLLRVTEPADIFRYASVSPDGKKIAFVRDIPGGIWTVAIDGTGLRQVSKENSWPSWSPNGECLAFLGTAAVSRGLSVRSIDTGREVARTAGFFLEGIGVMNRDGSDAMAVVDAAGKPLRTHGDNIAWR